MSVHCARGAACLVDPALLWIVIDRYPSMPTRVTLAAVSSCWPLVPCPVAYGLPRLSVSPFYPCCEQRRSGVPAFKTHATLIMATDSASQWAIPVAGG